MMNRSLLFIALMCLCIPGFSQQFVNILLDNETTGRPPSEPSIAINRTNVDNILGASILDRYYITDDGGETWTKGRLKSTYGVWGDPVVISDYLGNFFYFHLSDPTGKNWASEEILDRIVAQRSSDGGKTWSDGSFMGNHHPKDQDKEWAVADPQSGAIYATWTQFDDYGSKEVGDRSNILFSASTDQGTSWSDAVPINQHSGNCLDGDQTTEGAVPAVGPGGEVYVAWAYDEKIWFDRSTDKGKTWMKKDIIIADQPGGWDISIPGVYRCNGMPVTFCDLSDGPRRGRIYVNWADQRNGSTDTDIWVAWSDTRGNTWSDPVRVNDDAGTNQQFFTWMTIDQTTGHLYSIFYDRRNYDPKNEASKLKTDVYLAYSTDNGNTWNNVKVSNEPFIPSKSVFFGDYNNIDAHGGVIAMIWTRMDEGKTSIWSSIFKHEDLLVAKGD